MGGVGNCCRTVLLTLFLQYSNNVPILPYPDGSVVFMQTQTSKIKGHFFPRKLGRLNFWVRQKTTQQLPSKNFVFAAESPCEWMFTTNSLAIANAMAWGLSWDWVDGKHLVYMFFSGHSLWGRKTHKRNPPKSRDNPVNSLFVCVSLWWFISLPFCKTKIGELMVPLLTCHMCQNPPKGPSRTKITTESKFGTGSKIRYGHKRKLQRLLRNACFPKEKKQKNGTDNEKLRL